jgi:hypothetical protein
VSTESSSESTSPMATMKGADILKSRAHSKHTPSRKLFARKGTRARPSPSFRMQTKNRNVKALLLRCGVALRETAGEVGQRCASAQAAERGAAARQNHGNVRLTELAPRGAWLRQKSFQEISCAVVALLIKEKCVSSDAL